MGTRTHGIVLSSVFVIACVGDSNITPTDGGSDATTDVTPSDVLQSDAVDAPVAACDPTKPFGVLAALASTINNVQRVGWAQLTHDELSMTYASFNGTPPIHLYTSSRAAVTDPFTTGTMLAISGANDDDTPTVTGDNLTLYFSSNRPNSGSNFHIWAATRNVASTDFGSPLQVSSLTSGASEYEPFVSADGTVLYFASSRTGGAGKDDLYRATRPANGSFSVDSPGPFTVINTADEEETPVFTPDELTLYFASDRAGSKGSDVWKATRADRSSPFGNPTNVVELNSQNDESPSWISDDGCRIYVTRGGLGNYAIYSATKPK